MGEIFHNASRVYAWLSPPEITADGSSTNQLIGELADIGNLFWKNSGTDNEVGRAAELISNRESTLQESLPNLLLRFGKPLSQGGFPTNAYVTFSNRDYWKRIWIIQEVYQARNLDFVSGDASLPSNLLAGAITLIEMFLKKKKKNT